MAKRRGEVVIDPDRCNGCKLCIFACPTRSLALGKGLNRLGHTPAIYLPDTGCTGCGVCFYACPEPAAITVKVEGQEEAQWLSN